MKLEGTDYLYHGFRYVGDIETLRKIFRSGFIMTRSSLENYLTDSEFKKIKTSKTANWNGTDTVSLSCHPNDIELIDRLNLKIDEIDNAYETFISGSVCLFLDKKILDDFPIKKTDLRMNYEIQIIGDIPTNYIKAIGVPFQNNTCSTQNLIETKRVLEALLKDVKVDYGSEVSSMFWKLYHGSVDDIFYDCTCDIYDIKDIVSIYNSNLPVVDTKYGYEIPDREKQYKRLVKVANLYDKYRETRSKR